MAKYIVRSLLEKAKQITTNQATKQPTTKPAQGRAGG